MAPRRISFSALWLVRSKRRNPHRYASGLDPCKAPLVFLAVDLESVVTCLPERPLLQSTDVAAVLLAIRNRPLTTLRADPPGLRKVAPTVFAALDRWAHRRYNSVLPVPAALVPR